MDPNFSQSDLQAIALLLCRVMLGLLLLMQGYDKIFRVGLPQVVDAYRYPNGRGSLPAPLINIGVYFTSFVELIGGLMLIAGIFRPWVYLLVSADLVLATAGLSWKEPMPDLRHIFPRLVLLLALMLLPLEWDNWSADRLLLYRPVVL